MHDVTTGMTNDQKPHSTLYSFVLWFIVIYAVFEFVYLLTPNALLATKIYPLVITDWAEQLINLIAPQEQVIGKDDLLYSSAARLEIVRGCDGAGVAFLLCSAILACRSRLVDTLVGLALGLFLVYCLNLARIVLLYFVVVHNNEWFLPVHTFLAPTLMILISCLYFAWWMTRPGRDETCRPVS